jgi:NAD(P)-dependent dehydrogenase (short-subunit alcohol dehydrogenase family)
MMPPTEGRLHNKVAIVTGAGTLDDGWGNGKAIAVTFAREGATVVCVDRRLDAAESTVALIRNDGGLGTAMAADVSREDEVQRVINDVLSQFGHIDVLVNNVGVGIAKPTVDMSLKEWETVQRINLTSMFLTIREVLPGMLARKSGVIVNVSSIASMRWTGVPFVSYASSKAGVNQLTQSIAMEHALDGIRCNAVVPGFIDTPTVYAGLAADDHQRAIELKDERSRVCPTGAMGDAWDVANATLFLASEESRYITGNLLVIDGGLSHQIATPISGNSHHG